MRKKGAMELSIGTIVILVLAMSMLILGLVLVRTIFTGAKYNIDQMNKQVESEINKLFVEDKRAVLYLPNRIAEVKQGKSFGVGFGIQNTIATQEFNWKVEIADSRLNEKCRVIEAEAQNWITTGSQGSASIASGQKYLDIIRFNIPEGAVNDISKCIVRYKLTINQQDGTPYVTEPFDIDVK